MDTNQSELKIDTIAVRLIHGRKKKPRLFSSKLTWEEVKEQVCLAFPDLRRRNNDNEENDEKAEDTWHLEFDNGTWIEDDQDWQIALLFYQSLLNDKQKQIASKSNETAQTSKTSKNNDNNSNNNSNNTSNKSDFGSIDRTLPRFELLVVKGAEVVGDLNNLNNLNDVNVVNDGNDGNRDDDYGKEPPFKKQRLSKNQDNMSNMPNMASMPNMAMIPPPMGPNGMLPPLPPKDHPLYPMIAPIYGKKVESMPSQANNNKNNNNNNNNGNNNRNNNEHMGGQMRGQGVENWLDVVNRGNVGNKERMAVMWSTVETILRQQCSTPQNANGINVLYLRKLFPGPLNTHPKVKELNYLLYRELEKGNLIKFQPNNRAKPTWKLV